MVLNGNNIQAMIFDLDGSLMDSMWVWRRIDIEYLDRFGIKAPADIQTDIGGISMHETAIYFQKRFGITDSLEQMKADWNQMAWDHYTHDVMPKKGAEDLLHECVRRGIRTGIASSNSRELVEQVVRSRGMFDLFDTIVTGSEVQRGKPQPDIYLRCARELSVEPAACLVFEDIPDGIAAAHNAGMRCIAVYDPVSEAMDKEKRRSGDGYIRDFTEINWQ